MAPGLFENYIALSEQTELCIRLYVLQYNTFFIDLKTRFNPLFFY